MATSAAWAGWAVTEARGPAAMAAAAASWESWEEEREAPRVATAARVEREAARVGKRRIHHHGRHQRPAHTRRDCVPRKCSRSSGRSRIEDRGERSPHHPANRWARHRKRRQPRCPKDRCLSALHLILRRSSCRYRFHCPTSTCPLHRGHLLRTTCHTANLGTFPSPARCRCLRRDPSGSPRGGTASGLGRAAT